MRPRIVLIGGGEHALVVADALQASGRDAELFGYLDRAPVVEMAARVGIQYLGWDEDFVWEDRLGLLCFGGIGAAAGRESAARRLASRVAGWASVVHPAATVSASATIADGSVIFAGAVVNTGARIGSHAIINTGAIIEHDVVVAAHVQIGPRAVLGGGVRVGEGAYVAIGAVVRDHVTIGEGAVVGMGAVVTKDVPAGKLAVGHPARLRSLQGEK